ncbi:MAG TPA: exo 1,3/1,4-beta-D-glucan glucohydrolase [Baekduia sp.]|nr:exo 1,3/1,4-beta-D-glucan glucohydrolase [Baekduia sp.]
MAQSRRGLAGRGRLGVVGLASLAALLVALLPGVSGADRGGQAQIGQPQLGEDGCARIQQSLPTLADWPAVSSRIKKSKDVEARVRSLLSEMSLEEKVGQMTQPEIGAITPDEVREYHIGSILNGGGSWPSADKHAAPTDWLTLADAYWKASKQGNAGHVPAVWGIDAVHGNSNVYGATLFPHNIALGAAHDPCLVRDVEAATARQVRATGQDWAFAPTLAVVRDDRWGRTYEGFSEDPRITRAYGYEAIRGLQGNDRKGIAEEGVIATAKHFIGDGGTDGGKDQGVNSSSEAEMINVHGQGYYGALAAGAQTVMISFNSWTNEELGITEGKLHGSSKAINEILKGKMGFDGLTVSDWNGIGQVPGCTNASCPQAINAGLDVIMVPNDWKAFIANTVAQVQAGQISMARIDDAVTRILRVKIRSGVLDRPKPSQREDAGSAGALQAREVARSAVRKSQVLLKNNGRLLPLAPTSKVLVVGKSADSLQNQTGGWSLTWQGTGNTNADFPNGTTILGGLRQALGEANVTFSETGEGVDPKAFDSVIAVIGETPYAEGNGDLGKRSLENAVLHPEDLAVLDRVSGKGAPVATVFLSGRPLYVNKELNRSDAFVAAWLPGTEGEGVADLLVKGRNTGQGFTGTLSYSWPGAPCQAPLNAGDDGYAPLFPLGYGLGNGQTGTVGQLDETSASRCVDGGGGGTATDDLDIFVRQDVPPYKSYIGSPDNWGGTELGNDPSSVVTHTNIEARTSDVNVQQDARKITWKGGAGQFYLQSPEQDLRPYLNADGAIVFDTIVTQAPTARVVISAHCTYPCFSDAPMTKAFTDVADGAKHTIKVPLRCLDTGSLEFDHINTPFLIYTDGQMEAAFANIRLVPGAGKDADALQCSDMT